MIKNKKGHVVTIASMASYAVGAGLVDYASSKAAALAFHEGLAQELKHRYDAPEIKTTSVHPIYVRTKLIGSYEQSLGKTGAMVLEPQIVANAVVKQIISGRSGQICLPPSLATAKILRGVPWWLQELVRDGLKNDCGPAPGK
jgi:all-trans-retinol dehydrogenase (NAD+)